MIVRDNKKNEIRVGDLVRSTHLYMAGIVLSTSSGPAFRPVGQALEWDHDHCRVYWFKMDKVVGVPPNVLLILHGPRNDD